MHRKQTPTTIVSVTRRLPKPSLTPSQASVLPTATSSDFTVHGGVANQRLLTLSPSTCGNTTMSIPMHKSPISTSDHGLSPDTKDLIASFFKLLSESLAPRSDRLGRLTKRVLRFFRGTTENLVDTAATISVAVDPSGGTGAGFAGNLTKQSFNSLIDSLLENPSLHQTYEKLKKQLVKSRKRFLITIDDIDRLDETDMMLVIRMVKSIGQLPNTIYLLSYDRDVVWKMLDNGARSTQLKSAEHMDTPSFAEKIIQQELELPKPSQNTLLGMLDKEIAFMIGSAKSSTRWSIILRDGVHRWIRSPRDCSEAF